MFKTLSKPDPTKFLLKTPSKSASPISKLLNEHSVAQTGSLLPETPRSPWGEGEPGSFVAPPSCSPLRPANRGSHRDVTGDK